MLKLDRKKKTCMYCKQSKGLQRNAPVLNENDIQLTWNCKQLLTYAYPKPTFDKIKGAPKKADSCNLTFG